MVHEIPLPPLGHLFDLVGLPLDNNNVWGIIRAILENFTKCVETIVDYSSLLECIHSEGGEIPNLLI